MSGINIISYDIDEQKDIFNFKKTGRYKKIGDLGEGSFGKVILVKKIEENEPKNSKIFALKLFKKYQVERAQNSENIRPNLILNTEIKELFTFNLAKRINNPYIMKYEDWNINRENKDIMVLMSFFGVDLSSYFQENLGKREIINENCFKSIAFQILSGLNALHKNRIIHCDIKPQNILYNPSQNIIQITDYGLSQRVSYNITKDYKVTGGTYPYMAPDLLLGNTMYFHSLDIWSLGCVLVELCTGNVVFSGYNYQNVLEKIADIFGSIKTLLPGYEELAQKRKVTLAERQGKELIIYIKEFQKFEFENDDFYDLIAKMLCIDPVKRITAENAMKHSWFINH